MPVSVVTGLASLNQIAADLKDRSQRDMACQSLHQRFGTRSTAFLMGVLCVLIFLFTGASGVLAHRYALSNSGTEIATGAALVTRTGNFPTP